MNLHDQNVCVWALPLEVNNDALKRLSIALPPNEADMIARIKNLRARRLATISRGALRMILARHLETPVPDLNILRSANGKPLVSSSRPVRFSVSHSGELVLLAFATCEIGIDAEQICPTPDLGQLAERYFCAEESRQLSELLPEERILAFFRCWTRKEAVVKALDGLSAVPLNSFRVTINSSEPARVVNFVGNSTSWTLYDIEAGPDYTAALAHVGPSRSLELRKVINIDELWEPDLGILN